MDDLVQWLGEQLDEDARAASSWHTLDCDIHAYLQGDLDAVKAAMSMFHDAPGAVCDCEVPARVLREIDAKRRILARYVEALTERHGVRERYREAVVNGSDEHRLRLRQDLDEATERLADHRDPVSDLASVYAGRPGYREEWPA
ncbi:DUF6221 family protein [Streptomyces longispororuber]|uniref:DUF6221 family protein n=1 Tax=Streptomyces longispororuber TaxID=68230 RepID=UPI002109F98C|nr:DUF6221 family protein [Streptomyces longispororuber]MCQ4211845.1 DUF6221 family protein [Streptomyces longispororuber]